MSLDVVSEVEATDLPGCSYFKLNGGLDSTNATMFEGHVTEAQNKSLGRFIILDCTELKYVASAISSLVSTAEDLKIRGGALLLANPSKKVRVVFEMLGLLQYFAIFSDVSSALDFVREWIAHGSPPTGPS